MKDCARFGLCEQGGRQKVILGAMMIFIFFCAVGCAQPVGVGVLDGLQYDCVVLANHTGIYAEQLGKIVCLSKSMSITALSVGHTIRNNYTQAVFFANVTGIYLINAHAGRYVANEEGYLTWGFEAPRLIEKAGSVTSLVLEEPGEWPGVGYMWPALIFTNETGAYRMFNIGEIGKQEVICIWRCT